MKPVQKIKDQRYAYCDQDQNDIDLHGPVAPPLVGMEVLLS
jgi:hypothetical protein